MRRLLAVPLTIARAASAAPAQDYCPTVAVNDRDPQPVKLRCWTGAGWDDRVAGKRWASGGTGSG